MAQDKPIGRIEHVNLTVSDIERSAKLFEQLLGWRQRWRGPSQMGGETIHVGEEHTYLALYSDGADHTGQRKGRPMNHVGLLVADLAAAEEVVTAHGLAPFGHDAYEPGQRFYFFDWDGIEFEVVSYARDYPARTAVRPQHAINETDRQIAGPPRAWCHRA